MMKIQIDKDSVLVSKEILELFNNNSQFNMLINYLHNGTDEKGLIDILAQICKSNELLSKDLIEFHSKTINPVITIANKVMSHTKYD